jgi:folate-binding protein YgfZ
MIAAAQFSRPDRLRLRIEGPDRAKFLNNLATNDIKALRAGRGCETFITSPQGKAIAYGTVLAAANHLKFRSDAPAREPLLAHLAKYGVFDDVTIEDITPGTVEIHLLGPDAGRSLAAIGLSEPGPNELDHAEGNVGGVPVRVIREAIAGPVGFTLVGIAALSEALEARDEFRAISVLDAPAFDALRIRAGTPLYGREVTATTLPQEIDRDRRTINFVKGCYLGQETVARLDAMGHVNKVLRGIELDGPPVPHWTELRDDAGKAVGAITSCAGQPGAQGERSVGLAVVRTAHAAPGTVLRLDPDAAPGDRQARVVALPMTEA